MKNHKILVLIMGLLCLGHSVIGQTSREVYNTIDAYRNTEGITSIDVAIGQRTQGQIFMSGGNDYKIYSTDKALKKKLKKEYWGVKSGDSLYINCFPMKLGLWYAYAERIEDNLFFTAAITLDKEQQQKLAMTSYALGPIGGGISSGKLALLRFYYTMDLKSGQTMYLSEEKMLDILSQFPDLIERYKTEQEPEEIETLGRYLAEYKIRKNK